MTFLTDSEFADLFHSFDHTAFRIQTASYQPQAPEDRDNFPRWQRGEPLRMIPSDWLDLLREHTKAGRTMHRICRLHHDPEHPTRDELWHTAVPYEQFVAGIS